MRRTRKESPICSRFLSILITLRDGARRYKELEKILGLPQPDVSRLMKRLKELGLELLLELNALSGSFCIFLPVFRACPVLQQASGPSGKKRAYPHYLISRFAPPGCANRFLELVRIAQLRGSSHHRLTALAVFSSKTEQRRDSRYFSAFSMASGIY